MNSKAIRRQLLAAVAMVLVAAVALGSSTYAWFVASGTVTATGMSVKAQSEGNLVISYGGEKWGTSATAGMEAAKPLAPTSTIDLTKWVHASAKDPTNYDADVASFEDVSTNVTTMKDSDQNDSDYVVMKRFLIRSATKDTAASAKGLYVDKITVTANKTMSTSLRVGVSYKASSSSSPVTAIYAPVSLASGENNSPTKTYKVMQKQDDGSFARSADFTVDEFGATDGTPKKVIVPADTVIGNTEAKAVEVFVYIWFEGEDHNLYSDNFYTEDLSVSVDFKSISSGGTSTTVDLSGASAVTEGAKTIGDTTYYPITGKQLADKQLYAGAAGAITKASAIYTLDKEDNPTTATNVTDLCTLPA